MTISTVRRLTYFLRKGIAVGRISGDAYASSTEAVLRSLNLKIEDGQLKQAALLLFGKNPKRFFVSCDFRIGRFRNDESDLVTQDVVEGNILQMVNRIIELLRSKFLLSPVVHIKEYIKKIVKKVFAKLNEKAL